MKVDWQTYYDAAKKCHDLADELRKADKPVHDAVKGDCVGMAGDAPGCKQWGEAYDTAAQQTMQACSSLANALTNYGAVLYANGYNYGIANKSNPAPSQPSISQVGQYQVVIPSSVADNGIGFDHDGGIKEFFDKLVAKILSAFGKLPNGDKTKLDKAHTTWNTFANHDTITSAAARISAISALFDGMDDATNRQLIQGHFATLKTGADTVVTAAQKMADPVGDYRDATVALGGETTSAINSVELTIGITAFVGGALFLFSLGTSAAVAAGVIDTDVIATINAIQASYRASKMAKVLGIASLGLGAVAIIDAFHALPTVDLDKAITNLAAIIGMKAVIDDANDLGDADKAGQSTPTDRIKEHLTDRDLDAARRELNGEVVAEKPDGTPWDHVNEVKDAQNGLIKRIGQLKRRLSWPNLSDEERPLVEKELSEASRLLDYSEQFVPR
ncbi:MULTISPECIES: polymorphic toxin type 28 domain-containing protein [unclassified Nocardia]|uniref:polymorphic toxin type 28 domain-containing protein n=1 Tax=unclassified Nocardia TaxID=2637762 RepID=UPI001CE44AC6|nr:MULTISPECIES: polymorphic toxin type 28 domain-containing protein [unclassified Nocardia]